MPAGDHRSHASSGEVVESQQRLAIFDRRFRSSSNFRQDARATSRSPQLVVRRWVKLLQAGFGSGTVIFTSTFPFSILTG